MMKRYTVHLTRRDIYYIVYALRAELDQQGRTPGWRRRQTRLITALNRAVTDKKEGE